VYWKHWELLPLRGGIVTRGAYAGALANEWMLEADKRSTDLTRMARKWGSLGLQALK